MSLHRVLGLGCLLLLVSMTPMTLRGGEVSPPGDAVAASIARLDDADPLVRTQAAAALWAIDGRLRETLPVLVAARRSSTDEVRAAAGAVWGRIGAGTRAAMPYFLDSLRQRSSIPQDKIEAAFGPAGLAAVPALIDALETDLDVPASSASGATMNYANSRGQIAASVALAGIGAEAVPTLAAMLKDGQHVAVRTAAARALSQMSGPGRGEGREALPELIAALGDRDGQVRMYAAIGLRQLAAVPQALPALLPALIGAVDHKDPNVRRSAVGGLLSPDRLPDVGLEALKRALDDPDSNVRLAAAEALVKFQPTAAELCPMLLAERDSRQFTARVQAVQLLARIGQAQSEQVVPALVRFWEEDGHPQVRLEALTALTRLAPDSLSVLAGVRELVQDEDQATRLRGAGLLWSMKRYDESLEVVLPVLAAADPRSGLSPRIALPSLSRDADALPALARALEKHTEPPVRTWALGVLSQFPPEASDEVVPLLLPLLTDADAGVRQRAASELQNRGQHLKAAIPAVAAFLKTVEDEGVRMAVLRGLRFTRGPGQDLMTAQLPRLVESLKSPETGARVAAAQMLAMLGTRAAPAVPALAELLGDPSPAVVRAAADALAATGTEGVGPMTAALDRVGPDALPALVHALYRIGSPARPSMERFRQALESDDQTVRRSAVFALPWMGAQAIPEMVRTLGEAGVHDGYLRRAMADGLGQFGPASAAAVPALTAMLQDRDEYVRRSAARSLLRIDPGQAAAVAPVVMEELNHRSMTVRRPAAAAFGACRGLPEATAAALRKHLADADPFVAGNVAVALAHASGERSGDLVPILVRFTREGDTEGCRRAVGALAALGPQAEPALPRLIELLKSYPQTAVDVEPALAAIGPKAVEPLLAVRAAATGDTMLRRRVLSTLVQMGPSAAPHVIEFLRDQNNRTVAEMALRSWCRDADGAKEVVRLVVAAMTADRALEPGVLTILADAGPRAAPAVEPLIAILQRPDSRVDWGFGSHPPRLACQILGSIGPAAKAAVPALVARLDHKEPYARAMVAAALTRIDPDNQPAAAAVAELIGLRMGGQAMVSLREQFGPPPAPLVAVLKDALRSDEPIPQRAAALILAETDVEAERVAAVLTDLLRKSERGVPTDILEALPLIGPRAKPAVPVLFEKLDSCRPDDAPRYIEVLAAIAPDDPRLIPFLVEAVERAAAAADQPRPVGTPTAAPIDLRRVQRIAPGGRPLTPVPMPVPPALVPPGQAVNLNGVRLPSPGGQYGQAVVYEALARFGPAAGEAAPALKRVATAGLSHRAEAAAALVRVDPAAAPLMRPILLAALEEDGVPVSPLVPEVLGEMAREDEALRPHLQRALADGGPGIRAGAARALWRLDGDAEQVLPALTDLLDGPTPQPAILAAIRLLGEMARAAGPAASRLAELTKSAPSAAIRKAAADALQQTGPATEDEAARAGTP